MTSVKAERTYSHTAHKTQYKHITHTHPTHTPRTHTWMCLHLQLEPCMIFPPTVTDEDRAAAAAATEAVAAEVEAHLAAAGVCGTHTVGVWV